MNPKNVTASQKRALSIVLAGLLVLSFIFLRQYLITVITAAILAYLFLPLHRRLNKHMGAGAAAALTFVLASLIIIVPFVLVSGIAAVQVSGLVSEFIRYIQSANLQDLGNKTLDTINQLLDKVPYGSYRLTQQDVVSNLTSSAQAAGNWLLGALSNTASSIPQLITKAVIFIYVFYSLLVKRREAVTIFKQLNPLGDSISDLYLKKTGSMVKATVRGQFIIALMQGASGVLSVYIAGVHEAVFVLFIVFTILSLIPLGSGVLAIPLGLGLMAFGNIGGGLLIIIWHFVVTGMVDNIMRPILVPKDAQLDAALVMLSVFAGIAFFGLIGIVIGPVFMILVTTTIDVYRNVNYGVPMDKVSDNQHKPSRISKLIARFK